MSANEIRKALTGRTIKSVALNATRDGRGGFFYRPEITLDDGTVVCFVVQETEVGEYGVLPSIHLAALAKAQPASKEPPDFIGHGQPLPSLSVDTSKAERKDAARWRFIGNSRNLGKCHARVWNSATAKNEHLSGEELNAAIDAAMSADVRSQAQDTQGREPLVGDDQDDTKSAARPEPTR